MHVPAVVLLLALASPALGFYDSSSSVLSLDPAGLAKLRSSDSVHLVEFYAPWRVCPLPNAPMNIREPPQRNFFDT